jgi:hypothetical protein
MHSVIAFLDDLAQRGGNLMSSCPTIKMPDHWFNREFTQWSESCLQVMRFLGLDGQINRLSSLFQDFDASYAYQIGTATGIVASTRECLERGMLGQVKYLLHAEMFDSVAAQAEGLLEAGHRIPAAVLCRIVIEDWLRDEATKQGIADSATEKAAKLNDALKAGGRFGVPKWREIQSLMDIGNSAAHGKDAEVTADSVRRMLSFIHGNCL